VDGFFLSLFFACGWVQFLFPSRGGVRADLLSGRVPAFFPWGYVFPFFQDRLFSLRWFPFYPPCFLKRALYLFFPPLVQFPMRSPSSCGNKCFFTPILFFSYAIGVSNKQTKQTKSFSLLVPPAPVDCFPSDVYSPFCIAADKHFLWTPPYLLAVIFFGFWPQN